MPEKEPWKARILLVLGGIFGLHRLYLKQVPEAFVFFSTAGVFLIGILHDTFFYRQEVDQYNRELLQPNGEEQKEKYKKGKLQAAQSKFVDFSFSRFFYSVMYGSWIGLLAWLACTVTFGWTDINHVPFIFVIAAAVSCGVYIIGQCGGQSRELSFIWISAFSGCFIMIRLIRVSVFRSIFFTAISSTIVGNRSAKLRKRKHSWKHFLFWSSLYGMLICVIILGCSRKVMDKQVTATRPGNFRETTSVGSLIRDRFFDTKKVYSFFSGDPIIEYAIKPSEALKKNERNSKPTTTWERIWSGDMFDEMTGAAHLTKIDWIEFTTVFIVDLFRAESKSIEGKTQIEPFQWAAWRNYLIHHFELEPLVADDKILQNCKKWLKQHYGAKKEREEQEQRDYGSISTRRACLAFQN